MPPSLNGCGVFQDAISEHLAIIRQLATRQDALERAATLLTDGLLRGNKAICRGHGRSAVCQEEQFQTTGATV